MQKFSTEAFFEISRYLAEVRRNIDLLIEKSSRDSALDESTNHPQATVYLDFVRDRCNEIGLTVSVKAVAHLLSLRARAGTTLGAVRDAIGVIERTIRWEVEDRVFMYIPPERAKRYEQEEAFGETVAKQFPSSSYDVKEAGNCFASARYTACVFHLMRVLEIGLISFAKLFPGVPTNKENWQQIIEKIEMTIRAIPHAPTKPADWKEKLEQYSQAANSFMFFKDAWRNYTAHARGKYTEDEADSIYRNVKTFMNRLTEMNLAE